MSVGKNRIPLENYTKKSHFHFSSVCSPTVSGLGFSGGFWVDGELGFWSRRGGGAVGLGFGVGSSSRGSPVCRGFEVSLGFWSRRGGEPWFLGLAWALHPMGHRFAVGLRWVLGFGSRRGGGPWVCRGFGFVCRGVAVGLGRAQRRRRRK